MVQTTHTQQDAQGAKAGTKRSADAVSSPSPKQGNKHQKTIEESMDIDRASKEEDTDGIEDDADIAEQIKEDSDKRAKNEEGDLSTREDAVEEREDASGKKEQNGVKDGNAKIEQNGLKNGEKNAFDEVKGDANEVHAAAEKEQVSKTEEISKNNDSVIEDEKREAEIPSSIMEKGIIYFFFRSRVGIEDPQGIEDVARSYIVLRPVPIGAKIGDGPLQDDGNARLIALPKKMLPKSKQDRFLMFVEKPNALIKDLRDQFSGSEYATKTTG